MASPALPGLFCCFAAFVLLVFACVSGNAWSAISFLDANVNGRVVHFGVFGYTGIKATVGYDIQDAVGSFPDNTLGTNALKALTYVMILHPIAAAFALIACIFGLCGAGFSRIGTILMSLSAALATLITLVVWVIDMSLWGIVRNRIRNHGPPGSTANYGNANWLVLGALVALILGFCTAAFGSCMPSRRRANVNRV
ncbi:related to palI protein [Serendipita indica DSM 11827]|uniref:Related to palI protein n=1 Tax=Serendipita indica (strain DSM 11827) TaxID=1109443 RepID=G4TPB0_SERID|nr:related to palI protein [Serendipita indica DSM 11827]